LEFISGFGARTDKVEALLRRAENDKKEAEKLYIEGDYEACSEAMDEILKEFQTISAESMKLRKNALLWIYVIEWFVVTGTLFASGFVLWSLMIKRRLYREVSMTRSRL